jgi:Domain of unknown function (DUF1707)
VDTVITDFPAGDLRVSDADRDRAISELSEHFQAGRLTAEEFDERSGRALQARTGKDLSVLLADLPRNRATAPGPLPPARLPGAGIPVAAPIIGAAVIVAAVVLASGQHAVHHFHGFVSSGPNLAPLVPVLVVLIVIKGVARRRRWRRRGDRWER